MSIPFRFTTDTSVPGRFFDWSGTSGLTNLSLSGLTRAQRATFGFVPPVEPFIMTGISVAADKACSFDIGTLDITDENALVFTALRRCNELLVQGPSVIIFEGSGLVFPLSATVVPALKLITGSGTVDIAGSLDLYQRSSSNTTIFSEPGFGTWMLETGIYSIKDEAGLHLLALES